MLDTVASLSHHAKTSMSNFMTCFSNLNSVFWVHVCASCRDYTDTVARLVQAVLCSNCAGLGSARTLVIALAKHDLELKRVSSLCFIPNNPVEDLREAVRLGQNL